LYRKFNTLNLKLKSRIGNALGTSSKIRSELDLCRTNSMKKVIQHGMFQVCLEREKDLRKELMEILECEQLYGKDKIIET
jgi:hypothetical protein